MAFKRLLEEYEEEILDLIRQASDPVLKRGEATFRYELTAGLDAGMVYAELSPANPNSAKLGIQIEDETLVTLYIGHYGTLVECFSDRPENLHEMLTSYTSSVINGQYEEWVRANNGEVVGAIAVLQVGRRSVCIRYNTLAPKRWAQWRWRRVTYEPYYT